MRKKQIVAVLLAASMAIGLTACGSSTGQTDTDADDTSAVAETTDADAEDSSAETETEVTEVEPYMFNISYGGTPSSSMVAVMESLQEIMDEKSGGAFTFNVYNDNSYKESQALDELTNNVVDITYLASGSACTTITELAYLGIPGCYRYTDDASDFFDFEEAVNDIVSDIYADYGIHYLALRVPSRMAIVGTGDVPTTKEDLQGKVVRVSGTWLGRLAVSMNLATSDVGLSELATALQRKTVDSCITGIEQVYSQMLGEVVDYACILPETDGIGSLVIDEDTWNKLDADQQALLEECVAEWQQACLEVSEDFYDTSVAALEDYGVEIYYYSDEECDAFLSTLPDVYEEIDAQTTERGLELKEAILAYREAHN